MKKRLCLALSAITLFSLLASAVSWWLPKLSELLKFAGANTNSIQGLTGIIQIGLWLIGLITGLVAFLGKRQSSKQTENAASSNENTRTKSVERLLSLEIQQDCQLLQELLARSDQELLSDKWESRLNKNRSVWRDTSSRLSLIENNTSSLKLIQDFYQQMDDVEENCQNLLALKSHILLLESKPRYGGRGILGFDIMNPPGWASKYFTESDALALINSRKRYFREFGKLKEKLCNALDFGIQVIGKLDA